MSQRWKENKTGSMELRLAAASPSASFAGRQPQEGEGRVIRVRFGGAGAGWDIFQSQAMEGALVEGSGSWPCRAYWSWPYRAYWSHAGKVDL